MLTKDRVDDIINKIEIYELFEVGESKTCRFQRANEKENYNDRDDEVRRIQY